MKEISVFQQLLKLPYPLRSTSAEQRREEMEKMSNTMEVHSALDVLERCLHVLSQLRQPLEYDLPQFLIEYWEFSAEFIAEKIPSLEKLDLKEVKLFLEEEGIKNPSEKLIIDVAEYWLWWITSDLADLVLRWLKNKLRQEANPAQVDKFLEIASNYWEKIEPNLASYLLSCSALVGWKKALPLLKSAEQNGSDVSCVRETAQNYLARI